MNTATCLFFALSSVFLNASLCPNLCFAAIGNGSSKTSGKTASKTSSTKQVGNENNFGSLMLCPAGGKAFMMAWSLACEMRRKKRSTTLFQALHGSTTIPQIATEHSLTDIKAPSMKTKRTGVILEGYRPATLTEIMKICCEDGCEIRDLLAYCDPFGPWNS